MFRESDGLEVFLAHPGGPYFRNKDDGAWSIPKGLCGDAEDLLAAARREFAEEIGLVVAEPLIPLGSIVQRGKKRVHAWAFRGHAPAGFVPHSNDFEIEWPPRSGHKQRFPEVDRAQFFDVERARQKLNPGQLPFLDRLLSHLGG